MINKIKALLRDDRVQEIILYGIVGVITTVINYGVYFAVTRGVALVAGIAPDGNVLILVANIIAWIASVIFAFIANKVFVFKSAEWNGKTLRREIPAFAAARLFSLGFDTLFIEVAVHFGMHDMIAKLVSNVLVVIINYFLSKFFIFRKKGEKQ